MVLLGHRSVMAGNWKKTVMIGVAVAAVIAGIVIAVTSSSSDKKAHKRSRIHVTASGGGAGSQGELAAAAGYLGVDASKLRGEQRKGRSLAAIAVASHHSTAGLVEALVRARVKRFERLVAAKSLSPAAAKRRIARIRARVAARVARSPNFLATIALASKYLGLTTAELRAKMRSGRSMAQIADATAGKSASGLIGAVIAVREHELAGGSSAVAQQDLTSAKPLLEALRARVRLEVQRPPLSVVAAG